MDTFKNKAISVTDRGNYFRIGDREQLKVDYFEPSITHRVVETPTVITKIYNNNREIIALEIFERVFPNETVITNEAKRTTVVILTQNGKQFKGISKCNPCDKFDIQKGYNLAKSRANIYLLQDKIQKLMMD